MFSPASVFFDLRKDTRKREEREIGRFTRHTVMHDRDVEAEFVVLDCGFHCLVLFEVVVIVSYIVNIDINNNNRMRNLKYFSLFLYHEKD